MSLGDGLRYVVGVDMRDAERKLATLGSFASTAGSKLAGGIAAATVAAAGLSAALAGGAIGIAGIIQTGSQMEALGSRLSTIIGSEAEAGQRMKELFDFAAKTPFNVDQVVTAEVTLRGFGAAAEELMPGLIDFSAALGTDLAQSAIDFGKAWNQGAVGLESDTGKVLRKQIELRAGVNATSLSIEDFRATMLDVLNDGMFSGGADKLSKTMVGMVSNLEDEWSRFKLEVNDAGLFDNVKGALSVTLDLISQNREDIKLWAGVISGELWNAIKNVTFGFAYTTDAVNALGVGFLTAEANAAKLMAIMSNFGAWDGGKAAAYWVGVARETEGAKNTILDSGSAVVAVEGFFNRAELAAAGFNHELSKGKGGGKVPGAPTDKEAKDAKDNYGKIAGEAQEWFASLSGFRQTDGDEAAAWQASQLDLLRSYQVLGIGSEEDYAEAKLLVNQEYRSRLLEIDAGYEDEHAKLAEQTAGERKGFEAAYRNAILSGTQGLLGAISGMMDEHNAEQKAAKKALAIAEITISTAAGIAKAFEDYAWPWGLVPAGLIAATGAVQIAAVAQAHQGYGGDGGVSYAHQGRGPDSDERYMRVLRQEGIVNSQTTRQLGPQGMSDLNAGRGGGGTVINLQIGREMQREIIDSEMARNGAVRGYVRDAAYSDRRDAGFSGRRAP